MNPQASFWTGRRVFLTGHTGFKGSWLSLWLQSLKADVTGYSLSPPTEPSLFELAQVGAGMNSQIGDIRHADAVKAAVQKAEPEIVIHMAAQPLVRLSYDQPLMTYETNVMGTAYLLDAIRSCPSVRSVLVVTTDKCYENKEWVWGYREDEALGGYDPYSSSKACAELVTAAYRQSYFQSNLAKFSKPSIASARAGNVIGGGDWAKDRLIPDILAAFTENRKVQIRNPHAIRPWQHVLESLCGYVLLAERLYTEGSPYAQAWNLGPRDSDAKPVHWIVDKMASLWSEQSAWEIMPGDHPHEAHYLKLDISKASSKLGWQPRLNLTEALEWSIRWTQELQKGHSARELCFKQIEQYTNKSI